MAQRALDCFEDYIRQRVERDRATHQQVSDELKASASSSQDSQRGLSVRSIQRFCEEKGIRKTSRLSSAEVEEVVFEAVAKVTY